MTGRILEDQTQFSPDTLDRGHGGGEVVRNSHEAMLAEIAALRAENARLTQAKQRGLSMKVTDKGGLSVYGLGRFPVTLYRGQWERLLGSKDTILAFIEANAGTLSVKD